MQDEVFSLKFGVYKVGSSEIHTWSTRPDLQEMKHSEPNQGLHHKTNMGRWKRAQSMT